MEAEIEVVKGDYEKVKGRLLFMERGYEKARFEESRRETEKKAAERERRKQLAKMEEEAKLIKSETNARPSQQQQMMPNDNRNPPAAMPANEILVPQPMAIRANAPVVNVNSSDRVRRASDAHRGEEGGAGEPTSSSGTNISPVAMPRFITDF